MNEKVFFESDLGAAAFLIVRGFRLLELIGTEGQRYRFCFEDTEGKAADAVMGYLQGESVSGRELIAAEKSLKSQLYGKKSGSGRGREGYGNGYGYRNENGRNERRQQKR
jgi:hypothetical protein